MWRPSQGVTLIELILTMAIVGILASVSYPAMSHYVRESRRAEARNELSHIAGLQEQFFLQTEHYASLSALGLNTAADNSYLTENGYYRITAAVSASAFLLTAMATGSQSSDPDCQMFSLAQDGARDSSSHDRCW
jgi:prepilin-type N-terminal cleavage/methylation domain